MPTVKNTGVRPYTIAIVLPEKDNRKRQVKSIKLPADGTSVSVTAEELKLLNEIDLFAALKKGREVTIVQAKKGTDGTVSKVPVKQKSTPEISVSDDKK